MKVDLAGNGGTAVLVEEEEEERRNETERNNVDGDATAFDWVGMVPSI